MAIHKLSVPGPVARAVLARNSAVISPSYPRDYPFVMDHGRGSEVWDVDGNRYIDWAAGMARTGKMWAVQHAGVEPDIVCPAKGIASGLPLGAMVARQSVMTWPRGAHSSTTLATLSPVQRHSPPSRCSRTA
jgi:4-aminobutyrate aminotransferase-like enzyme